MNDTITTMLEPWIPYQDPTARCGTLSTLYAQAIDAHMPKQTLQPKQPWITQTTRRVGNGPSKNSIFM